MATDLRTIVAYLRRDGGLSDGQLLARFVSLRDEAAFAGLVRRHGRMVLGVCRRVLRDHHDAEDAFQATFLVLARKAASVVKRESVGSWLYGVAYRTALDHAAGSRRRRAVETQVERLPHPEVMPDEVRDWQPLLDREVSLLPEPYRAAVVLCDLEGRTRREAARHLGIPEGTLSSRLAAAHKILGQRLARCGLVLSGGVAALLAQESASADAPAALVKAVLTQLAAEPCPAAIPWKGALRTMLISKWWPVAGAVIVAGTLAAVGVGFRAGDTPGAAHAAPPKPEGELEALRKENDLLKLNLQVVLEKLRAQETELEAVRDRRGGSGTGTSSITPGALFGGGITTAGPSSSGTGRSAPSTTTGGTTLGPGLGDSSLGSNTTGGLSGSVRDAATGASSGGHEDLVREAESALKALRQAKDKDAQHRATEALEKAMKRLREQLK